MALTKVKDLVAEIGTLANATTEVSITGAGGDIENTVAGVTIGTFSSTGLDLGTLRLTSQDITAEDVRLTNGVVAARLDADGTELNLETTSAHPVVIGANSIDALTVATDGKVTLGVDGTAAGHLIDKGYVDNLITGVASLSDIIFAATSTGSLQIPTDGDDFIINWGITASIAETNEAVVFDTAFPNAVLGAFTCRIAPASREDSTNVNSVTTTGMNVAQTGGNASQVYWMAFGY